ncbi:MAG: ADP-ribosylation factor-like protein [candidate division WOR-3 bacterium]|nr:ADP-ribosylation factor-like protein [candidate division WOR-3 bacterium]MCX7946994.1 ADP-ribosylation factor-like protein [candidate division WOR-3 bacterium]MDW8149965.1 ADP-ribosylation factor-like protein [candidate division WOR-3 bacterium]
MFIDTKKKEINVKIVYYGPALSGKTTNLKVIYAKLNPKFRGDLVTVDTKGERTLYFDFLPIEITLAGGFKVKFHVYTVPGQVFYKASRKLVLKGADGIVFVADSSPERRESNIQIMQELIETLEEQGISLNSIPLVIQYNKRDIPNAMSIDIMNADINHLNNPYFEAIASQEKGVFETLDAIVKLVIKKLTTKTPV